MTYFHKLWQGIKHRVILVFSLDLRALSILRIGLAVAILIDLTMNMSNLTAHFTDAGVLPIDFLLNNHSEENYWSLHSISGNYRRQCSLFLINYAIAIGLLIGWKTRWMHVLARFFFCSVLGRNPIIASGADAVLRLLLFRAMFLPTQYRRSWDTRWIEKPANTSFFSRATVGLVVQIVSIYFWNYQLKTGAPRISDFSAVYQAFSIDMFRTVLGTRLYQFPALLKLLTMLWIIMEWWWALFLFIPRKNNRCKSIAILSFVFVHLGMVATLKLGLFPWTCSLAWIALLPSAFRDTIMKTPVRQKAITHDRSILKSLFLVVCLLYITMRNLRSIDFDKRDDYFPQRINKFWFLLRLDQYRSMFAPYPITDDGRFVIKGNTRNNKVVNLLVPNTPVSYEKPEDFSALYPDEKRRKYFLNMRQKSHATYRPYYLQYQCKKRNSKHPENLLIHASMEYVVERTEANYQTRIEWPILLADIACK